MVDNTVLLGAPSFAMVWLLCALFIFPVLYKLRFDGFSIAVFLGALGITCWYFVTLSPFSRANDIDGHLAYIHYVATEFALPAPLGWQSQQPPLFYVVAAFARNIAYLLQIPPITGARFVSTCFHYAFLITSALIFRQLIQTRWIYRLCLLTLVCWPVSFFVSVKISNDVPLAFFCILTVFFLLKWTEESRPLWLGWALAASGLAIATKGTGLAALALVSLTILFSLYKKRFLPQQFLLKPIIIGVLVIILGLGANFGRTFAWKTTTNYDVKWLINRDNGYIGTPEHVGNTPANYLVFNYFDFVARSFNEYDNHTPSAHWFWNIFLKSLLYTDSFYNAAALAQAINGCFLVFLILSVRLSSYSCLLENNRTGEKVYLCWLGIILSTMMVIAARIEIASSHQGSGRYIYFIIPLLIALYGMGLEAVPKPKRMIFYSSTCILVLFTFMIAAFNCAQL